MRTQYPVSACNRINTLERHLAVTGGKSAQTPVLASIACQAAAPNNPRRQKTAVTKWHYDSDMALGQERACFKEVVQAMPAVPKGKQVIKFCIDGAGSKCAGFEARLQSFNKFGVEIPGGNTGDWQPASDSLHWSKEIVINGGMPWHPTCVYVRMLQSKRSLFDFRSDPPARVRASMEVTEEFRVEFQ